MTTHNNNNRHNLNILLHDIADITLADIQCRREMKLTVGYRKLLSKCVNFSFLYFLHFVYNLIINNNSRLAEVTGQCSHKLSIPMLQQVQKFK